MVAILLYLTDLNGYSSMEFVGQCVKLVRVCADEWTVIGSVRLVRYWKCYKNLCHGGIFRQARDDARSQLESPNSAQIAIVEFRSTVCEAS